MTKPEFKQLSDSPTWWRDESVQIGSDPPVCLTTTTDGEAPDAAYSIMVIETLERLDELKIKAAELILDNYSYEHFKDLGVEETRLVSDETPEAIAKVIILKSAWFNDARGASFELSFGVPWDDYHSYDVEFDHGHPSACSVNG